MSGFTSGFKEFQNKIDDVKKLVPMSIDYALDDTGKQCVSDCENGSPVDTGTLFVSWEIKEDNKQTGSHEDISVHSIEVWSNPSIISQNPKYPNGEYYPPLIEDGFDRPDGTHYQGNHMLKNALTLCPKNLKTNLKNRLSEVFNK